MKANKEKHVRRENKIPFWELCLDMARDQESPSCIKIYTVLRDDDARQDVGEFEKLKSEVLNAIDDTCLVDFESSLAWAQWCRDLANGAVLRDTLQVDRLLASQRKNRDYNRRNYKGND